jgi:RNA polymerase sigma-70 factor (ECF subfamily)
MVQNTLDPAALAALFASLRRALGRPLGEVDAGEIGALLCQVIAEATARHADFTAPAEGFARHLIEKLPAENVEAALMSVRAADLYLAFACAQRDAAALAAFEATFSSEFRRVLARSRGARPDEDDFRQACREKLFAAERPKIAEYSGQGDLRSFLRVTLVRTLIDLSRKRTEAPGADEDRVQGVPAPGHDPELDYLKRLYASEFKQAFEEAALALSPEDRNVLRYHFAHGLTIDQLGALYSVHRATAARRVTKAREELLSGTRKRLMARLRLDRDELDSVMRMIESDVHVSLNRVLAAD